MSETPHLVTRQLDIPHANRTDTTLTPFQLWLLSLERIIEACAMESCSVFEDLIDRFML